MAANIQGIQNGWDVYGSDGEKVGDVAEVGSNYLLVQKGWFFTKDYYIPTSAITSVEQNEVRLSLASSDIANQGWDAPPADDVSTGTYTSGTMGTTGTMGTMGTMGTAGTVGTTESVGTTGTFAQADTTSARTLDTSDEVSIPIVEESISVGKREVDSGGVRVTQRVEETPVREQVSLRDENVSVERRAVDRAATGADFANVREGVVEVRERDEQAVVEKQARIVEEVVVGKEVRERTETIEDTVRRTDVDVQQLGGETNMRSTTTSSGITGADATTTGTNEGAVEGGFSRAGNAAERATGLDLDRDQDVGQRDPRNNF